MKERTECESVSCLFENREKRVKREQEVKERTECESVSCLFENREKRE